MEIVIELLLPLILFSILLARGFKKKSLIDFTQLNEEEMKSKVGKFTEYRPRQMSYPEHIEKTVWNELLKFNKSKGWKYGVFETEKYIETVFPIKENIPRHFFQMIYDDGLYFRVVLIEDFPIEATTDLFILATHFNNALSSGSITVNVKDRGVSYTIKNELDFYAAFPDKIERDISNHYFISQDILWAFEKYLNDKEDPAFIFADFMEMIQERDKKNS